MTIAAEIDDRIAKCQKILDLDPNSQIFAALAEAYRKKGELDKAFRICQNGLKIHPSYGSAHIVMAKINLDRGLYDWAEAEVEKAIEIDGRSRAIELLLAEIYIYKGEFNSAVKLLKSLHQSDPDNKQIKKLLDIAIKLPEEQQAVTNSPAAEPDEESAEAEPEMERASVDQPSLSNRDLLAQALLIPEVNGALFINNEGLLVNSEWALPLDPDLCGATMADADSYLSEELVKYSFGNISTVLIETADRMFYLVKVEEGMFVFAGTARTNLGTLRMKLTDLFERYDA